MVSFKVFILLLLTLNGSEAFSSDWLLSSHFDDVKIWKNKIHKDMRIVTESKIISSSDAFKSFFSQSFLNELKLKKKRILDIMGVSNWESSLESLQKYKSGVLINFSGSYLDKSGAKIYYQERHFYDSKRSIQMLLTSSHQVSKEWAKKAFEKIEESK